MNNLTTTSRRALVTLLLAPLLAAICACQAAPEQPKTLALKGVLVMKGNLPHSVPVLQTDAGNWELLGVDIGQMKLLQRQRVLVTGRALASEPPQRQRLQVEKIEPLAKP